MDEKTIKQLLGLQIKHLRKKHNLTQFALGEKIGIDQRQIAYIEGGNSFPSLKTLNKFCDVFNCQLKDLFDYEHFVNNRNVKKEIEDKISILDEKSLNLYYQILNVIDKSC